MNIPIGGRVRHLRLISSLVYGSYQELASPEDISRKIYQSAAYPVLEKQKGNKNNSGDEAVQVRYM